MHGDVELANRRHLFHAVDKLNHFAAISLFKRLIIQHTTGGDRK
ncbi:Uncharacterised protein [Vibrio cholerae]|nr:Uncharacterised protein [Vibrio cholerae]